MPEPLNYSPAPAPPALAEKLLALSLPAELREQMLGDLYEEFQLYQVPQQGLFKARCWYYWQTIQSIYVYLNKQKEGVMGFIISAIVFFAAISMGMWFGGEFSMFFDIPSVILVVPPALLFALAATSVESMKWSMKLAISEQLEVRVKQINGAKRFLQVLGNSAILMSLITTLIGAVAMASHISASEFSSIFGPAFAVCILVLYYALIIKTLCYVAYQKIEFRYEQQD